MKKSFVLLFIFLSITCFAQFSKTHYIPPLSGALVANGGGGVNPEEQYIYISTPSITPIQFKIKQLGSTIITGTVSRDLPYVHHVQSSGYGQLIVGSSDVNTVMTDRGYIIEADDMIYVAARVIAGTGNQSGALVSKGLAALGTRFRIGGFLNTLASAYASNNYTFVSVLATENNTVVQFSGIKAGAVLVNNTAAGNTPSATTLNAGESFVMAVQGPLTANRDALIGSLVTSNKPIALNCGSFGGTNGEMGNQDLGFDQIVPADRIGNEYIFIKSTGLSNVERALLIADEDNTQIFLNGSTTASYTINAGQYVALVGTDYSANGNLFVRTSKNIFAYQSVGDNSLASQANQELFFVPPLSCQTPHNIDNIPMIEQIGTRIFTGRVTIVSETNATLNFIINGIPYTLATLPSGITVTGPLSVTGNDDYQTYVLKGLTGNVSAFSSGQLYLAAYGSDGAATFGGFYSGFTFKPEVTFGALNVAQTNCIPNVLLNVSTLTSFNSFQWHFNNTNVGTNSSSYAPTQAGYYYVTATITACGITLDSDKIPVSDCALNDDNDLVNNNIDLDLDNDGLTNCYESLGNLPLDTSTLVTPTAINLSTYSNSFIGNVTTTGLAATTPFIGNSNGTFITEVTPGIGNSVTYEINTFSQPLSVLMEYVSTANASNLANADANFIVKSPINTTITVLNPTNQLLIDTNYDGIYESGISQYSSFEIRFRINGSVPLAAGTGTFSFRSHNTTAFSFTQSNLSDTQNNKATFALLTTCVPKDHDGDGIPDQLDYDSDNDGIPDNIEVQGQNFVALTNMDANFDGIDDAFALGLTPKDTDADGVFDYFDLDSDNDGIFDVVESGSNAIDANMNGIIDGNPTAFGSNGLLNALETTPDSGNLITPIRNTDNDALNDYLDLDSDTDSCSDVIEAGFTDGDGDTLLGNSPLTVNSNGVVTSGTNGYTLPNANYITAAPISIITPIADQTTCATANATFTITTNTVNAYQWQVSTNGISYSNITNGGVYSGVATATLQITGATNAMNGYKYRVVLSKNGNTCGKIAVEATLTVLVQPIIIPLATLIQCDDNLDGLIDFNLRQKESEISTNASNEVFTYYLNQNAAQTANAAFLIANPTVYNNVNGNTVWVRVENPVSLCYDVMQINLNVVATQIPPGTLWSFSKCDDYFDAAHDDYDGVTAFDFHSVTAAINGILPTTSSFTINYYRNESDALAENDPFGNSLAISQNSADPINIYNYRNIGYTNQQMIWVRVDSTVQNACFGLGPYIKLTVEALPVAHPVTMARVCDRDTTDALVDYNFDTSTVQTSVLNGQTNVTVTYFDGNNNPLSSPLPNPFLSGSQNIRIRVTNNATNDPAGACFDETTLTLTVDEAPKDFTIAPNLYTICDDELDPLLQDGSYNFTTSQAIQDAVLLGQPAGMDVKYYDDTNALLSSPLSNPLPVLYSKNIKVEIENPVNPTCKISKTIPFVVNPTPKIELLHEDKVCSGANNVPVTLEIGLQSGSLTNYSYEWFWGGVLIPGATAATLPITVDGNYTTIVTDILTGCKMTRTNNLTYSQVAKIMDVIVTDISENNTVTIIIDPSSIGSYEYSIDNPNGPFQDNAFFENIEAGFHTVYVNDKDGCGIASQTIAVIGAPHFFTPNGDGINDFWSIKGVNGIFNKNSKVVIFDRFGKFIKEILNGKDVGWDGTYNGHPLDADDYWYVLYVDDGRVDRGHFTLKR